MNQIQFPQYYVPPASYLPTGLPSTDGDASGVVAAAAYPGVKDDDAVPAGLPTTTGSPDLELHSSHMPYLWLHPNVCP